ncbi:Plasmodium exported protein, unknown function [Plasmodium reichenowi]|uniref:Putative exported protein n=1 Tax=Plasmodium reichenowi TaxID=5854 RepID=A0A060RWF9_PLARE|nr:putative exported protein [Plasmodium reichenowi]KYN94464.1 putative exported protein [Plasmodium reichenowi]CDO65818.1 Plasmodium exported protein, unknown function [Plasmodium reichenowi]SOV81662.1 Plasmodium exported protein, unknown function [Plasmodium reichenowi]
MNYFNVYIYVIFLLIIIKNEVVKSQRLNRRNESKKEPKIPDEVDYITMNTFISPEENRKLAYGKAKRTNEKFKKIEKAKHKLRDQIYLFLAGLGMLLLKQSVMLCFKIANRQMKLAKRKKKS